MEQQRFVVMSAEKAEELGIKPMAKIVSYGSKGLDPSIMGYGPFHATKKALENSRINSRGYGFNRSK